LIKNQGLGDLYRIYSMSKFNGIDFNLASIPNDFRAKPDAPFDRTYMGALFDRGYEMGRRGYPWVKSLPGLQPAAREAATPGLPVAMLGAGQR
jgi:hypothetical protein